MVLQMSFYSSTFILVFHRILDFKTGLNFYSDPFFVPAGRGHEKAPINIGAGAY